MVFDGSPDAGGQVEQFLDLGHGESDEGEVGRWWFGRAGRGAGWFGVVSGLRGGDGADGESGHDQHDVSHDRGVQAGLGLVEAELVLAELVVFFDGPAAAGHLDRCRQGGGDVGGWVGVQQ